MEIFSKNPQEKTPISEVGDITNAVSTGTPITSAAGEYMQNLPPDKEHSLLWLIDTGIQQSKEFCVKADLPEPATAIYENFSRPLLNKALLHYIPDTGNVQSPAACLMLGLAGVAACYIPVLIAMQQKRTEAPQTPDTPRNEVSIQNAVKPQAQAAQQATEAAEEENKKPSISDLIIEKFSVNSGQL
jgi:hypothetical protein